MASIEQRVSKVESQTSADNNTARSAQQCRLDEQLRFKKGVLTRTLNLIHMEQL